MRPFSTVRSFLDIDTNFDAIFARSGAIRLDAAWAAYGFGFEGPSWTRMDRLVVLQGVIFTAGAPIAGDVIGQLPAKCWPRESLMLGGFNVDPAGVLTWQGGATAPMALQAVYSAR